MIITGIDIETTGLEQSKGHRIIEFAAVLYNFLGVDNYTKLGSYVKRICPQRPIDAEAQRVHGISFEDVSMEPPWEKVAPNVVALLKKTDLIVGHNGDDFDMPFIHMELVRIGIAPVSVRSIDTCKGARWATPNGKYPKLQELCFAVNVPYDPTKAHAALYDVEVMMQAYFAAMKKGFFPLPVQPAIKEVANVVS